MKYATIREEELKNKIATDYFWLYDCTRIIGNVDFCVAMLQSQPATLFEQESLMWAEAKKGSSDIHTSLVQLILTIGKARTFDKYLPPAFLGAFDAEKIAFIPYNNIQEVFYLNDFNWNVAPSNHDTKEFKLIYSKVKDILDSKTLLFFFGKDDKELHRFIKLNFVVGKFGVTKIKIDKNNFIAIYNKWLREVKPTIAVNWDIAKKSGIIDGDFYLADLLSQDNKTLKEKLFVLLNNNKYELDRKIDEAGIFSSKTVTYTDKQVAHTQFWNKYERPPKEEYWDYIVERRDLLVPQDIRERKGSFFTPQIWVELSQRYLAEVLGENWQDEYYIWDCAAGTGNLLAGLINKYNIWASTLDQQDVEVMRDRIANGANLLEEHVFQFDFLNDEFLPKSKGGKMPDDLYKIINDENKRKKLVIYINPPYAEATTARTVTGTGKNKSGVAKIHKANQHFKDKIGSATNEVFALFMAQVYEKISGCLLAQFSKLKFIQGTNFQQFKEFFRVKFLGGFVVPADTFDNVKGNFPIGFTIWNTAQKELITEIVCDVYGKKSELLGKKSFYGNLNETINKWIIAYNYKNGKPIGFMGICGPDFQNNKFLHISSEKGTRHVSYYEFSYHNLVEGCIYFAVRHCIEATWLNDRDQFLYPNDSWQTDSEFQNDCLAFTLFHGQNRITSKEGTNHWIPFSEQEVNARQKFESNFMSNFIKAKLKINGNGNLFDNQTTRDTPLVFSAEATAVFEAGRELWKYYHSQEFPVYLGGNGYNVNASLYDIKEYFQGRDKKGKMNNKSKDETYNQLIAILREKINILAQKIEPKVYLYGFLRR
jgi:hypothetical protein